MENDKIKYRQCPVCENLLYHYGICSRCGFDESKDYAGYLTLGEIPAFSATLQVQKEKYKMETQPTDGKTEYHSLEQQILRTQESMSILEQQSKGMMQSYQELKSFLESANLQIEKIKALLAELEDMKRSDCIQSNNSSVINREQLIQTNKQNNKTISNSLREHNQNSLSANKKSLAERIATLNALKERMKKQIADNETVTFGLYPQTADGEKKPVEWQVLKQEGERVLLLSKYVLECRPFCDADEKISESEVLDGTIETDNRSEKTNWKNSTIALWLNSEFVNAAFDPYEQRLISTVGYWNQNSYKETRIFLLSEEEANSYFNSEDLRKCLASAYVEKSEIDRAEDATVSWWLRTPAEGKGMNKFVSTSGKISQYGEVVEENDIGVRPALWIDFGIEIEQTKEEIRSYLKRVLRSGETEISFGHFPQGKEGEIRGISWEIKAVDRKKIFLISKYCLLTMPYDITRHTNQWKDSSIREWLNGDFVKIAFDETEENFIFCSLNSNEKAEETEDYVFLLSAGEAEAYYKEDAIRRAYATEGKRKKNGGYVWWWLRSPGNGAYNAVYVYSDGPLNQNGNNVTNEYGWVRPALWLNFES